MRAGCLTVNGTILYSTIIIHGQPYEKISSRFYCDLHYNAINK